MTAMFDMTVRHKRRQLHTLRVGPLDPDHPDGGLELRRLLADAVVRAGYDPDRDIGEFSAVIHAVGTGRLVCEFAGTKVPR